MDTHDYDHCAEPEGYDDYKLATMIEDGFLVHGPAVRSFIADALANAERRQIAREVPMLPGRFPIMRKDNNHGDYCIN